MAHTFHGAIKATFRADLDLSDYQYYAVTAASTEDYVKLATGGSVPAPIGILQTDSACAVGDPVEVVLFGPTKAKVAAATTALTACDVDTQHYLVAGGSGWLNYAGSGLYNAYSLGMLDSGCATINVFFIGSGCIDAAY